MIMVLGGKTIDIKKPVAVNKVEKPVIIFKNRSELKEFPSIQTASKKRSRRWYIF